MRSIKAQNYKIHSCQQSRDYYTRVLSCRLDGLVLGLFQVFFSLDLFIVEDARFGMHAPARPE